jgi:hypothetical protein
VSTPEEERKGKRRLEVVGDDPTGPFRTHGDRPSARPPGDTAASTAAAASRASADGSGADPISAPRPAVLPPAISGASSADELADSGERSSDPIPLVLPASAVANRLPRRLLVGRVPFAPGEAAMLRSLARTIAGVGVLSVAIGGICIAQWAVGRASVPSAVFAVLAFAVGLWSLLASWHFHRVVSTADDVHQLASAFGNLRSIFILKAIGFFLALALSCFAFSIVASLLALL